MNGLLIQWGFLTTDGSTTTVYPLTINFSNTYYSINATVLSSQNETIRIETRNIDGFTCYAGGTNRVISWRVIGY